MALPQIIAGLVAGLKTKKGKELAFKVLKKSGMINQKQFDKLSSAAQKFKKRVKK